MQTPTKNGSFRKICDILNKKNSGNKNMSGNSFEQRLKERPEKIEFLCTVNSQQDAFIFVSEAFERGEKRLLIQRAGASKTKFSDLNKELRKHFFCTPHAMGFIVYNAQKPISK